jgi:hypothetical protein
LKIALAAPPTVPKSMKNCDICHLPQRLSQRTGFLVGSAECPIRID